MKTDLFDEANFEPWGVGVHYDIPDEEYHSIKAVSSSSLKQVKNSLRHFEWYIDNGSWKNTPQMQFGKLVHLCLLEHELYKEKVIVAPAKNKNLKAYKDFVKDNPDKIVITTEEEKKLALMFESLSSDKTAMKMIKDGIPEVTILAKDPDTGLNLKARIDLIPSGQKVQYLLDYKTSTNVKPAHLEGEHVRASKFERVAYDNGYCNQAAFYLFVAGLHKIQADFFVILAQETTEPYLTCPYIYGFETLEAAADENRKALNNVAKACRDNHFPGYTCEPKNLARPYWGLNND